MPARNVATIGTGSTGDAESRVLPLRIDAAILLDQVLRLKSLLAAKSLPVGSRLARWLDRLVQVVFRVPARRSKREQALERYAAVLLKSGLFDAEYYLRRYPDVSAAGMDPVMHYLQYGASELCNPGPHFSTQWYVLRYPDVAASGKNPLYHFIVYGYAEGRQPLPISPADLSLMDSESDLNGKQPVFGPIVSATAAVSKDISRDERKRRLVVYASLFGEYDDLFMPSPEQARTCDFVLFSDRPNVPLPWRRGDLGYAAPNQVKNSRFYKLLPHRLFPEHEWSLYLDANVDIRMNPVDFLERYCDLGPDFFAFRHPTRSGILEELGACIFLGKDDPERMVRQVVQYLDDGFRQDFELTENNVLLRRHNEPEVVNLSEAWWAELRSGSHRDQLSLSYVVERENYRKIAMFENGQVSARSYPGLRVRPHRHQFNVPRVLGDVPA